MLDTVGNGGIVDETALHCGFQGLFKRRPQILPRRRCNFQQHVPRMLLVQGVAHAVAVPEREVDSQTADDFEAGGGAIGPLLYQADELDCGLGDGTPTKAVSTVFGAGNSLSTAAVMTPSVPSAPTNRFFRS
jgi:hypothetical protein